MGDNFEVYQMYYFVKMKKGFNFITSFLL